MGFLGFQAILGKSDVLNITTDVLSQFAYPFYSPVSVDHKTFYGEEEVSDNSVTTNQTFLATNHYAVQKAQSEVDDLLMGSSTTSVYGYDNYGNVQSISTSIGGGIESDVTTITFGQYGTPVPSSPVKMVVSKIYNSEAAYNTDWL